jgi:single-stranded DNA-binding protein
MNMHLLSGNIVRIFETRTFKKTGTEYLHFVVACDGPTKESEANFIEVRVTGKAVPAFVKWAAKGRLIEVTGPRVSKFVNEKKIDYTQAESYKWLTASKKAKEEIAEEEEEDDTEEEVVAPVKAAKPAVKASAKKAKAEDEEQF